MKFENNNEFPVLVLYDGETTKNFNGKFTTFNFSKSDNTLKEYQFNFHERFAFSESVIGKNLDKIQNFASNDTLGTYWNDYQYFKYNTKESEETFGLDLEYAFRLSKVLSGKVKIGNKIRTKSRNFDQNHEFFEKMDDLDVQAINKLHNDLVYSKDLAVRQQKMLHNLFENNKFCAIAKMK